MSGQRQAWDYQPGVDTTESYQAFTYYLALPRTGALRATAQALNLTSPQIGRWAKIGLWYRRAVAWDENMLASAHEAGAAAYARSAEQRAHEWEENILGPLRAALAVQSTKMQLDSIDGIRTMKPHEVARLLNEIHKAERLMHGEATEIQGDDLDLEKLTPEQRDTLYTLMQQAKKG